MFANCTHSWYDINETTTFQALSLRARFRGIVSSSIQLIENNSIPLFHAKYGEKYSGNKLDFQEDTLLVQPYPCLTALVLMVLKSSDKVKTSRQSG